MGAAGLFFPKKFSIFVPMSGSTIQPRLKSARSYRPVAGVTYACNSVSFRTFCKKLYYFSNFKDFNTLALNH